MKYVPMTDDEILKQVRQFTTTAMPIGPYTAEVEKAVLARIEQQGLVIVPREPTAEMLEAAGREIFNWNDEKGYFEKVVMDEHAKLYKAMLEATKEST
jgi:hypothetical protein